MDLFLYNPTYQVWICTGPRCQYVVSPLTLLGHLRTRHRSHPTVATPALCQAVLTQMLQRPWADPGQGPCPQPSAGDPPIPGLPVYQGHRCPHCPYICRSPALLHKHRAQKHRDQEGHWGQGRLSAAQAHARAHARPANRVVSCQQFFTSRAGSYFFEVTCAAQPSPPALSATPQTPAERIRAHINQALQEREAAAELANSQVPSLGAHPTEVSPWLELTRWLEYLRGQDLTTVALLGNLPDPAQEPLLALFSASGLAKPLGPPVLPAPPPLSPPEEKAQNQLDQACLTLSIALLDHTLKGDPFESTLVAFLAVLGVDPTRQTFREPYSYTSYLSGLVKMAQMLVALQAVHLTKASAVSHPADALDEMREHFLVYRADLAQLFLLHEEEVREEIVPQLALHELQDDPIKNQQGWNFLQDQHTQATLPTTGERWLLDRVLGTDWLQEEFLQLH
ncbi:telomere-associated RecQ helicase, putative [Aspergillus udagawae]|uniref:Telomere-associated RecQ helicase, putative n=1 Tax=Aspergillus udagawae TaxID=91492 RepID=A0A8H3SHD0_9EURO|nr:telomere-associated RecQ helicase, putative [Aspergillus udagawae]